MSKSPMHRAPANNIATRAKANTVDFAKRARANTVDLAQRAAANTADLAQRATTSTANITRKHSRVSVIAASAAAAGLLGAAGFTAGAAPWSQVIDSVTQTGSSHPASAQLDDTLFKVITGTTTTAKPAATTAKASTQLDSIDSATNGTTGTQTQPAKHLNAATVATAAVHKEPAKAQAAKAQPAKAKVVTAQPAKAQVVKAQAPAEPTQPYTIYDSVTPSSIPSGQPAAVYVNGEYATSWSAVAGHKQVLWIDTNGSDPHANVLDVEPGDATPAGAEQWVDERLSWHSDATAIVYTMMSDWQQVKDDIAQLPTWMQSKVQYWIADPTGYPHVVPGSTATQWYWGSNYDLTTALPNFDYS